MTCEYIKDINIYPLTMIMDRYNGAYSNAKYTAWNLDSDDIPDGPNSEDIECLHFWEEIKRERTICVGRGETPNDALLDLNKQIKLVKNGR